MKYIIIGLVIFFIFFPLNGIFAEVSLNIDKTIYEKSDFISIWGNVSSKTTSVFITINDPDGNKVWNESLAINDENKFSTLVIAGIGGWEKSGNYVISVESGEDSSTVKFFYDSGVKVNPPSAVSDYYVSQDDLTIMFIVAGVIVTGVFVFLARNIILRKKTSYDSAKVDSKRDRDYEKYHSDWTEEEVFGARKTTIEEKEFREMFNEKSLPNYYETLGVANDSTENEIKNQYRKLAKEYHPDRNKESSEEKMAEINNAYEVLSDKKLKAEYDKFYKLL
tara:strand:+ start:4932 stop:5768 length:837 start_codon:yes stop_codon:yes gene_type:complete